MDIGNSQGAAAPYGFAPPSPDSAALHPGYLLAMSDSLGCAARTISPASVRTAHPRSCLSNGKCSLGKPSLPNHDQAVQARMYEMMIPRFKLDMNSYWRLRHA